MILLIIKYRRLLPDVSSYCKIHILVVPSKVAKYKVFLKSIWFSIFKTQLIIYIFYMSNIREIVLWSLWSYYWSDDVK